MTGHTALYARVSTDDQSLDRQREETWNYTTETLDVAPGAIEVYEDTGTGRDTQRDGFQDLMRDVRAGEVARLIVLEVSRLSRSMRDLATTVEAIVDESDTGLHILDMNLALKPGDDDPYQRAFLNTMGTITQLKADMIRERVRSEIGAAKRNGKHTGRPPFGFDVTNGYLTPNQDYDVAGKSSSESRKERANDRLPDSRGCLGRPSTGSWIGRTSTVSMKNWNQNTPLSVSALRYIPP